MKRFLSTGIAIALLLGLGILAVLARPGGGALLGPPRSAAAPVSGDTQQDMSNLAVPNAPAGTPRYNHIALPLDTQASIIPFTAQGLLNYIGSSALQVANLNASSQTLDFWDGTLGFGIVGGTPVFDPSQYPLQVGHPYLVQIDSSFPPTGTFSIVGDVPAAGSITFTLVGNTPCKYNEIMVPLDQYDQGLNNAADLATAIGNVNIVAKLNATSQTLDFWDLSLGFGIYDGVPIYSAGDFPIKLGYPYFVCVNAAGNGSIWP